jgi:ubiquinone/menaquinone biosynthesis C-methylase UbiE
MHNSCQEHATSFNKFPITLIAVGKFIRRKDGADWSLFQTGKCEKTDTLARMNASEEQKIEHLEYQRRYFDRHCDVFKQPIPEEIEERTRKIVRSANLGEKSRVLDVGTGMGVLIKHFLEEGVSENNVTGCDLSANMLAEAKKRFPKANFWQGDIGVFPTETASNFDAVFFNACFGNIFGQARAIEVAAKVLRTGGRIIISHPLGNEFVQKLKNQDQNLILTLLPDRDGLLQLIDGLDLSIEKLIDESGFYLAVLLKHS